MQPKINKLNKEIFKKIGKEQYFHLKILKSQLKKPSYFLKPLSKMQENGKHQESLWVDIVSWIVNPK